jgi:drug/metabolite transporter (DMT)-like permease
VILAAIGLALVAAALHGTWNVLVKVSRDPLTTFQLSAVIGAVGSTPLVAVAWVVEGRPAVSLAAVGLVSLSAALELTYMWLLSAAYARGEISVVYPIARGSAPLLAVVIGIGLIGERLSAPQLAGVTLLLAGILAVTLPQTGGRATMLALLTGVMIAAYTAVDRVGVRLTTPWMYLWMLVSLLAVGMTVSMRLAERVPRLRSPRAGADPTISLPQAALVAAFMWTGYLLVLIALSIAPLSVVAPVRETAVVAVAVWGVWRLRERRAAVLKLAGAGAVLAGVSLLAI